MAKKKKTSRDPYAKYKANVVMVYMLAMMLVYVLYCRHGYVDYDYEKAVVLYGISGIFAAASAILFLMSVFSHDGLERIKRDLMPTDYLVFALFASWMVSFAFAADKNVALWGDTLRRMGLLFHLSFLVAFLIISHWGAWNQTLTIAFLVMCAGEWMMQILQYFGIDLFNWQFDHEYPNFIGTLGAVDHNAYFDGIVLTVVMCLFLLEEKKLWKAIYGIALFVGFLAGIQSNSDSFTAAFGMGILVMLGYCLYRGKRMLDFSIVYAIIYAAAWVQRFCYHFNTYTGTYEEHGVGVLESMLYSNRWMALATVGLVVLFLLSVVLRRKGEAAGKILLTGYLSAIGLVLLLGLAALIYANVNKASISGDSIWSKLVLSDTFGNYRGYVWIGIVNMMKQCPVFNKLFGFGFSSMSTKIYEYNPEMETGWNMRWADGHNTVMDLLVSSGVIGVALFVALCVVMCIGFVRAIKKNEKMVLFLALFMAYVGASLINSNLIVTTPVIFMFFAVGNNYAHHLKEADSR